MNTLSAPPASRRRKPILLPLLLPLLLLTLGVAACQTTSSGSAADEAFVAGRFDEAFKLYRETSEQPHSQYRLALLYEDGQGVEQNFREALRWMVASAEAGYAPAMRDLGQWAMDGHIVEQNPARGAALLDQAARKGDGKAMYLLGLAYAGGFGVGKSEANAAILFRNANQAGYPVPPELLQGK